VTAAPSHAAYMTADHGVVLVPARVARVLVRQAGLEQYHVTHRGLDPELDAVLVALKLAGASWTVSAEEGEQRKPTEGESSSSWLTTREAADQLVVTDSRIRQECRAGRLDAELVGRTWRISRDDLARYRAARAA
jgi:excisionase family DNA binding protein